MPPTGMQKAPSPENAPRFLFIGAAHLDRIGTTFEEPLAARSNPGRFVDHVGGAALNTARVVAAHGFPCTIMTCLGDDAAGQSVREELARNRIALGAIACDRSASYTSIHAPDGSIVSALADMEGYEAFAAHADFSAVDDLGASDWLFVDANLPETTLRAIVARAKCNIAAAAVSIAKAPRLKAVADKLTILFCNRGEYDALFAEETQSMHPGTCIVSDGENALTIIRDGLQTRVSPATCDAIVDVTGAGDALAGGTLAGLASRWPLRQAAEYGTFCAGETLRVAGAWSDMLIPRFKTHFADFPSQQGQ